MTGIEEYKICILNIIRCFIAFGCEHILHTITVVNIHLAAIGFDMHLFRGRSITKNITSGIKRHIGRWRI